MTNDALEAALAEIRRQYGAQLAAKLELIETLAGALEQQTATLENLRQLQREVHTLAGSAPTFGYAQVGAAAARADLHLKPLAREERLPAAGEAAVIASLAYELRHAAGRDAPDAGPP